MAACRHGPIAPANSHTAPLHSGRAGDCAPTASADFVVRSGVMLDHPVRTGAPARALESGDGC